MVAAEKQPKGCSLTTGEVSEWLKEHAWKACVRVTVPGVRIPPSPFISDACAAKDPCNKQRSFQAAGLALIDSTQDLSESDSRRANSAR